MSLSDDLVIYDNFFGVVVVLEDDYVVKVWNLNKNIYDRVLVKFVICSFL